MFCRRSHLFNILSCLPRLCRNSGLSLRVGSKLHCMVNISRCVSTKTHYDVLGLRSSASRAEIRSAFIKLSKQVHPDRNPADPNSHLKFIRVHEAYKVLSKTTSRHKYDLQLAHQRHAQAPLYAARSNFRRGSTSRTESYYSNSKSRPDEELSWDELMRKMRNQRRDPVNRANQASYNSKSRPDEELSWDELMWKMRNQRRDPVNRSSQASLYVLVFNTTLIILGYFIIFSGR